MRGSDEALAPLDETLEAREPGALLLEAGALKGDSKDAETSAETALAVPETDPERIAYSMWQEGRVDEAIQYLERHLAAERDRRRETALVPGSAGAGSDAIRIEPASDWRERHRAALSSADFNAFGAPVHTIDVTPTQADAIIAHGVRRSMRSAWLMVFCLAVLLGSSAAAFWYARGDAAVETAALPAAETIVDVEPATSAPAVVTEPETQVAATEPDAEAADVPPPDDTEVAETPPLETEAAPGGAGSLSNVASLPEDAGLLTQPSPSKAAASDAAAADTEAPATDAPEMTASIEPMSDGAEPQPVVDARLPQPRPEPPASVLATLEPAPAEVPLVISEPEATPGELPLVISEPPARPDEPEIAMAEPDQVPIIGAGEPVRIFKPIRRLHFAPMANRVYDPYARPTLTPAEYQALLERRALAQDYVARRRFMAERRIFTLP